MTPARAPDWNDLQILLAVLRAGSLTRAAAESGISQPTIGRRIRALEARIKAPLFFRLSSGVEATPLALRIGKLLDPVSASIAEVTQLTEREAEGSRVIRLTTTTTLSMLLAENLRRLTPSCPGFALDIQASRDRADFLRKESDMALRLRRPPENGPVKGRKLGVLGFAVYGSKRSSSRKSVQEPLQCIGLSDNRPPPQRQWFDNFAAERGAVITARLGEVYLRLAAVREGLGLSLLPCILGDREPALVRVTPPIAELAEDIYLLVHDDIGRLPVARDIAANLAKFIAENRKPLSGED
ncbi:LysR family transcriptional regulator [Aestuariivirga sp.]|uniref:LysR family transcriptional regulator n=1 Tax=Aestuariivirga sp. TaxID=2650926 RepID=UPI00391A2DB1